jgi:AcrR family transcriptional regulator
MTRPSEITRDRIMRAAERLFAERGYDGTSIRAIVTARESGGHQLSFRRQGWFV